MIKEVELQSKVCEAIRDIDGFAQKTSNRFLIGVPDVLCQLPGRVTSFWEVKRSPSARWHCPDLRPKQKLWQRDFTRAGGFCGIIYFFGGLEMSFTIQPSTVFDLDDLTKKWRVTEEQCIKLPRGCKFVPFKEELVRIHVKRGFEDRKAEYGY